jgi:hypothetical protein
MKLVCLTRTERTALLEKLQTQHVHATTVSAMNAQAAVLSSASAALALVASVTASAAAAAVAQANGQSATEIFNITFADGSKYRGQVSFKCRNYSKVDLCLM